MKIGFVPQVLINSLYPRYSVPYVPLGLLCVAGALDRKKHQLEIVDLTKLVKEGVISFGGKFEEDAARLIISKKFDLIGFSSFSASYHHTLKISCILKELSPGLKIVFGGPQATFCDLETMKNFPIDYIVRGEGEITFSELINVLETGGQLSNVKGLTYRLGGEMKQNESRPLIPDINILPYPAFDLYPIKGHYKVPIEGTRGCPFNCTYCATSRYWGRKVRHKSCERIFEEMKFLTEKYFVKGISFADDTLTVNRPRTVDLCNYLIKKKNNTRWYCSSRIDTVDKPLLELMSKAGCSDIFYGIESGSPKIQKLIKKNINLKVAIKNIELTAKCGIGVTASFIMGFPDETEEDLIKTLKLRNEIKRLFPRPQAIQLHVLAPDVNTEVTLDNLDRLDYDGFHSDQAGGGFTAFDKDLILKHKDLFLAYYYIKMKHLSRDFIRFLSYFMFATHLMAYWSSLYIMHSDKNPLTIFKKWLEFHEGFLKSPELPKGLPENSLAMGSVMQFLDDYSSKDKSMPEAARELLKHELEQTLVKGLIITTEDIRKKADRGDILSNKKYNYDPDLTIEALRKSLKVVSALKPSPTSVEYFQSGFDDKGPVVSYRKK